MRPLALALLLGCSSTADLGGDVLCPDGLTLCRSADALRCLDARTDAENCGGCGTRCPAPFGATGTCVDGRCAYRCEASAGDCNGLPTDGCELSLATARNCGACGVKCDPAQACVEGRCTGVNLAMNHPATQSSVYTAGMCDRGASRANDGRFCAVAIPYGGEECERASCTGFSLTNTEMAPWWQVDLEAARDIEAVEVWSGNVNRAVAVQLSDDGTAWRDVATGTTRFPPPTRLDARGRARYVRVVFNERAQLDLAEVIVVGRNP